MLQGDSKTFVEHTTDTGHKLRIEFDSFGLKVIIDGHAETLVVDCYSEDMPPHLYAFGKTDRPLFVVESNAD